MQNRVYVKVFDKFSHIGIKEGASDEKQSAIEYVEYLADCLKTGKLQVKWNIT